METKSIMRIMPIFFIFVLCSISFLSCSADAGKESDANHGASEPVPAENKNGQETSAESKNALDDLGEFDFGGHKFKIYNRVSDAWANCRLDFEELTGEAYNDAVFNRNRLLEDRFNIEISMVEAIYSDAEFNSIKKMILSGGNEYDFYSYRGPQSFILAQEGLINDIGALPSIDLGKDYWDDFITDQLTLLNKKYFAVGAFNITFFDYSFALIFNKQLLQNYALENPYELVKSGKWTYGKFAEMGRAATIDLNGDGIMDKNDAWGYVARSNDVLPGFWVAANVKGSEKDNDDVPQNMMGSEKFLAVIDKIFQITHENNIYFNSDTREMFIGGNVLFNDVDLYMLKDLRAMETDFGILPYPKFDESQQEYYTRAGGGELFFTDKSAAEKDLERTSVILEAMACESLKTCVPAYYDLMLKTKFARDVESEEIIDYIVGHRVQDWVDVIWVGEIRDGPLNAMFLSKKNTLVSLNESKLENIFNSKRDGMVEAFSKLKN